jgi:hypothetical protein
MVNRAVVDLSELVGSGSRQINHCAATQINLGVDQMTNHCAGGTLDQFFCNLVKLLAVFEVLGF